MSVSYPLVRNFIAFSTRRGVLRRPSRLGSSPSSASSCLIRSCILLFYLSGVSSQSLDTLYADRAHIGSARRAAEIWRAELARDPRAFDTAWKLARAGYWLGGHAPQPERRAWLEEGVGAGRTAAAL